MPYLIFCNDAIYIVYNSNKFGYVLLIALNRKKVKNGRPRPIHCLELEILTLANGQ